MDGQDGAVEQQMSPEVLQRLMQQQQPAQRNLTIGGLSNLLTMLNDLEFTALQGDLQSVVNYWLRQKGLMV